MTRFIGRINSTIASSKGDVVHSSRIYNIYLSGFSVVISSVVVVGVVDVLVLSVVLVGLVLSIVEVVVESTKVVEVVESVVDVDSVVDVLDVSMELVVLVLSVLSKSVDEVVSLVVDSEVLEGELPDEEVEEKSVKVVVDENSVLVGIRGVVEVVTGLLVITELSFLDKLMLSIVINIADTTTRRTTPKTIKFFFKRYPTVISLPFFLPRRTKLGIFN